MKDIDVSRSFDTLNLHIPGRKIPDDFKRRAIIVISIDIELLIYISTICILQRIVFFLLYYRSILFSTFENNETDPVF